MTEQEAKEFFSVITKREEEGSDIDVLPKVLTEGEELYWIDYRQRVKDLD